MPKQTTISRETRWRVTKRPREDTVESSDKKVKTHQRVKTRQKVQDAAES